MNPTAFIEGLQINALELWLTFITSAMIGLVGFSLAMSRVDVKTRHPDDEERF